jgi:hypothetical protein
LGIIIVPIAATADEAVPDIAPKIAHAQIVAAPSPPFMRPKSESAKSVSFSAIPLELINMPAIMKKGIDKRVSEFNALKPTDMRKEKSGKATIPI